MKHENLQNPEEWAAQTFGMAECGDPRRTDRLVQIAAALAGNPSGSLPECMRSWNDTQAAYRLLENEAVTYEQIMKPHWTQTAQEAAQYQRTLLLADTTNFTLSTHTTTSGLGPIGRGKKGKGYYAHTVVAMDADQQQLLGCLYQDPFVRQPAPRGETREQRKKRAREGPRMGTQHPGHRTSSRAAEVDLCRRPRERYLHVLGNLSRLWIRLPDPCGPRSSCACRRRARRRRAVGSSSQRGRTSLTSPSGTGGTSSGSAWASSAGCLFADQFSSNLCPATASRGLYAPEGNHAVDTTGLGTHPTSRTGTVGVALAHNSPHRRRHRRVGAGRVVQMPMATGGVPQGAQDWLCDGRSLGAVGGEPMEVVGDSHPGGNALALASADGPACA